MIYGDKLPPPDLVPVEIFADMVLDSDTVAFTNP